MRDRAYLADLFDAMSHMSVEQVQTQFNQDTIQEFNQWKEQADE